MRVSRTDWHDWYVEGDESAVLVSGQVVVVSALATSLLAVVLGSTDLDVLAAHLEAEFGTPPDGDVRGATEAVVDDLVAEGVLVVDG